MIKSNLSIHIKLISLAMSFCLCIFMASCGGGGGGGGDGGGGGKDSDNSNTNRTLVLDKTFGTDGIVTTSVGSDDRVRAILLQPDGKTVMAGYSYNGSNQDIAVVRYNTDGSLDTTFNSNGIVTTPVGYINDRAFAIALQNDGKIVVAGDTETGGIGVYTQFGIVRYNTDGSLDTTFNSDGIVKTSIGGIDDEANGIAIQKDGKIVVAGYSDNGSDKDIAVVRYNTDGSLDTTFNSTGKVLGIVTTPVGSLDDRAYAIALQNDGKIVVAGDTKIGGSSGHYTEFALLRYNPDGSLDTTFNSDGIVTTSVGGGIALTSSIAVQADGKIIVLGTGSDVSIRLARFNADGTLDITFDSDGIVTTASGGLDGEANGIALQEDGKIVVVGTFAISKDETYFLLVCYNIDGTLDTTFDSDGMVEGPNGYFAKYIALQPDGKIVVAGHSTPNGSFFLMRYE